MSHRLAFVVAAVIAGSAGSACGPESTSFRPVDRTDSSRTGPPSALYDVHLGGQLAARAHVWSNGSYMSSGDEAMTHIGFEINSLTMQRLTFDADALELIVFDDAGEALPPTRFTTVTPLGPALLTVPPASTIVLGAYFLLPVRPRAVGSMQVRWTLRLDGDEYRQRTGFVRDDDVRIIERVPPPDLRSPNA